MCFSDQLLSADTGPLHIACAMDTPVVALFGKSDPAIYGPSPAAPYHRVIRRSDNVDDITVDDVREALLQR
jgi:ADP-heptose:LPS heptosyltransferase